MEFKKFGILSLFGSMLAFSTVAMAEPVQSEVDVRPPEHCRAQLEIRKVGPSSAMSGDYGRYRIEVWNRSRCHLHNVTVTDRLSAHTIYKHAWPNPTSQNADFGDFGGIVKWENINLGPGDHEEFEVKVKFITDRPHIAIDTGCAFHEDQYAPACDSAQTTIQPTIDWDRTLPITRG